MTDSARIQEITALVDKLNRAVTEAEEAGLDVFVERDIKGDEWIWFARTGSPDEVGRTPAPKGRRSRGPSAR